MPNPLDARGGTEGKVSIRESRPSGNVSSVDTLLRRELAGLKKQIPSPDTTCIRSTELAHMLLSAFRYALGRRTAIVSMTVEWMTRYWPLLATFHLQIRSDIRGAIERGDAGSQCDIEDWRKVLALPVGEPHA